MLVHIVIVDVLGNVGKELAADLIGGPVENHQIDRHLVLQQKFADGIHCHPQGLIFRIAIGAGGDQGEGHGFALLLFGQGKAFAVAGSQKLPLTAMAAVPHGAHGMDHVPAGQVIGGGDFGIAGPAAAQSAAFRQKLRPGGSVDGAVHSAAAQQGFLGGVDDGVHLHFGDIVSDDGKGHNAASFSGVLFFIIRYRPEKAKI